MNKFARIIETEGNQVLITTSLKGDRAIMCVETINSTNESFMTLSEFDTLDEANDKMNAFNDEDAKVFCRRAINTYNETWVDDKKYYLKSNNETLRTGLLEALQQLTSLTWDGDLLSKSYRNKLVDKGLALKCNGYNIISKKGIKTLNDLELIKP